MHLTSLRSLILAAVFALTFRAVGKADVVSFSFTDVGSKYTLQVNTTPVAITGSVKTYSAALTIDTSNYLPAGDWIAAVAIKLAGSVEDVGTGAGQSSLVSTTAGGSWTAQTGGTDAGGCDGKGSGFLCAKGGTSATTGSNTYVWNFDYATKATVSAGDAVSVKAVYDGKRKEGKKTVTKNTNQTSVDGTLKSVPDGGVTMMLLGTVLAGVETVRRKFRA